MGDTRKRLEALEEALEESDRKRRKLKKRVRRLEESLEELGALLEDEDDDQHDHDQHDDGGTDEPDGSVTPSGHRELSRPDASWTVARLREAATSRGLTGVSRMTKTELIAALTTEG